MLKRRSLWFCGPGAVEIRGEPCPPPGTGEVLVKTRISAISAGTELLFYRGSVPEEMAIDSTIAGMESPARFPFKYGYACVGTVAAAGRGVGEEWVGKRVFGFHPHESAFCAPSADLHPIPDDVGWEDAVFLANMETAVNFGMDAAPLPGETAAVFGLGVVGLLTTALLAQLPLAWLAGIDPVAVRREWGRQAGADQILDPTSPGWLADARGAARGAGSPDGLDLALECSGSPAALDQAIAACGFEGRVVIGSWYGKKAVPLQLGGEFHRSRIRLIGSQVSTIAAGLSGRWSKARRFKLAWEQIRRIGPCRFVSHRMAIEKAGDAYSLLANQPGAALQVLLEYGGE